LGGGVERAWDGFGGGVMEFRAPRAAQINQANMDLETVEEIKVHIIVHRCTPPFLDERCGGWFGTPGQRLAAGVGCHTVV